MGAHEHRHAAAKSVRCALVTISDSRTPETDHGGRLLRERLSGAGHEIVDQRILPDEPDRIRNHVDALASSGGTQVIITTGGTGVSPRDSTFEALDTMLEKRLDGFGELFRMLSYQEIGSAAMLSRAVAGTYRGVVICALPGAPDAVRLALEKLILPELTHLAWLVRPKKLARH